MAGEEEEKSGDGEAEERVSVVMPWTMSGRSGGMFDMVEVEIV
jgi:hypothetical protein